MAAKAFLEEYGVIVVAAIVICIVIVVSTPVGNLIKSGIIQATDTLTVRLEKETVNFIK